MVKNATAIEYITIDFDPFEGPEIVALAPATEPQKEIWISCVLGGENASRAFNESVSLNFTGELNKDKLESAIHDLKERHELLRCAFSADGKQICIFTNQYIQLSYEDLSHIPIEQQEQRIRNEARQEVLYVFDLLNGPLFIPRLLKLSANQYILTLTAHHIVCDGWSLSLIMQELGKIYSAHVQNIPVQLQPAVSFTNYANEKHAFYKSEDYKSIEKYWINQYIENVPVVDLKTDFQRPAVRTYSSNRLDYKVDTALTGALKQLANKSGCSFVTTLISAFEVFLHLSTGKNTLVLGLPAADQATCGQYNLVGHCVNLLPLKSRIDNKSSFINFLKQRKQNILDSFDHQQFTFGSLLKKLNIQRDPSRVALVPVVFNVDMGMNDGVIFHGLQYEFVSNPRAFETFEIFLNISGTGDALTFQWSYNTQLFRAETINGMMEGLESLLKAVVENSSIAIEEIQIGNIKRLANKSHSNVAAVPYPTYRSLGYLIEETAAKLPTKTALIFGNRKVSYEELNNAANQLARYLISIGIRVGDLVGVALDRSPEMLISLLAVMKAGAVYLPLDMVYPPDRIKFMLANSSATYLITNRKYQRQYVIKELIIEDVLSASASFSKINPSIKSSGDDLSYVLYTSGSTGNPKGVLIRNSSVVNMLCSMLQMPGIAQSDILLAVTTISFDIAVVEMFLPLIVGATIVLTEADVVRNGRALLQVVKEQQITIMQATPSTYKMMLAAGWENPMPIKIICGGEPMSKDLADKLLVRCMSLYNMYGPTETTVYSLGKQILSTDEIITIGRPINNTQVYILDENCKAVADGATGEIYIAGEGVGSGYLHLSNLTAEKFIKNPFDLSGGKMYKTGDLGKFLTNGEIQCLGRVDRQIKLRGYRIEPAEIEHAIMKLGQCKEVLVVAKHDKNAQPILIAYVVLNERANATNFFSIVTSLKDELKVGLPHYMVPDHFISLTQLPLLLNGKIDYNALPESSTQTLNNKNEVFYTETEKLVSKIWSGFLSVKNIGIDDNFFLLGGHSLIAVEVMMRLEKETGIKLPLSSLFEYPTIRSTANLLQADQKETIWKSLVPIKPTGTKMPVYIIHGSGSNILNFSSFAQHMDSDQPVYGLQAKGLAGSDEPLDKMEEIAAYYISEVIKHNPKGPYAIAGYSFGGYVAIEMAKQLRLLGKEVKMLAMLDTNAEEHLTDTNAWYKALNKIIRQFKKGTWITLQLLKQPRATINYQLFFLSKKIKCICVLLGFLKEEKADSYLSELERISKQNDIAYYNYRLKPFEGTIDLFKAKRRIYFVDDFKFLGWKKYALEGVKVHEVPGDHQTMLESPNDKIFAQVLQKALENCKL